MTREERTQLIKHLKYNRSIGADYVLTDKDADEVIKALEQEPCVEDIHREREQAYMLGYEDASKKFRTEPCEDCISRQAAIDAFERFIHELGIEDEPYNYGEIALSAKNVPPITPQQNTGHWITLKDEYGDIHEAVCSCCDKNGNHKWAYCPNCGRRMEV